MQSTSKLIHKPMQKKRSLLSAARGVGHWINARLLKRPYSSYYIPALDIHYTVKSDTIFSWHLAKYRAFESDNTNFLTRRFPLQSGGLFVDVGANFGWFTCLFSKLAGNEGKVIAFEPAMDNLSLLRKNLRTNGLHNVHVIDSAVGAEPGNATLCLAPEANPGMHSLVTMAHTPRTEAAQNVAITTLDDAMKSTSGRIRLLKIDIEGYEIDALRGASETLARCDHLLIEYSPGFLRAAGHAPSDLIRIIENAGFKIYKLEKAGMTEIMQSELQALEDITHKRFYDQIDLMCIKPEAGSLNS